MILRNTCSAWSLQSLLTLVFSIILLSLFITPILASPSASLPQTNSKPRDHDGSVYTRSQDARRAIGLGKRVISPRARGDSPGRPKRPEYVAHPAGELVCRPFGECEPCPRDELDQPFCYPFGNRRLLHCIPASSAEKANKGEHVGEVPAWESCGKVIKNERQNFWEFVTANLLFLIVALTVLWARTSALATEQYRQLAARIGIPSGGWTT